MKTHTTREICAAAGGVSYRTLRRWIDAGLLEQPVRTSDGRTGVHLQWTPAQLRRARAVGRMRKAGMAIERIAERVKGAP